MSDEAWKKIPITRHEINGLTLVSYDERCLFLMPGSYFQLDSLHRIYIEVWLEGIYNMFTVGSKHVVDVGGFLGDTALYFLQRGAKFVDIYEPGQTGDYIEMNMILNRIEAGRFKVHNEAVTGTNGEINANEVNFNFGMTSFERDNYNPASGAKKKTLNLADIAVQDAVLKFDTEGSEYKTFENADKETIRKFECIMLEFHDRGHGAITGKLRDFGFEVHVVGNDGKTWEECLNANSGMLYAKRLD